MFRPRALGRQGCAIIFRYFLNVFRDLCYMLFVLFSFFFSQRTSVHQLPARTHDKLSTAAAADADAADADAASAMVCRKALISLRQPVIGIRDLLRDIRHLHTRRIHVHRKHTRICVCVTNPLTRAFLRICLLNKKKKIIIYRLAQRILNTCCSPPRGIR